MPRPKPEILIEQTNKETFITTQVLLCKGIWSVFYQNQPINIKRLNYLEDDTSTKYRKVSFSNSGHAIRLAKKLNLQFRTTDFTVIEHDV